MISVYEEVGSIPYLRGQLREAMEEDNPTHAMMLAGRILRYTENIVSRRTYTVGPRTRKKLQRRLDTTLKLVYGGRQ